jgi:hypothetical protein
MNINILPKVNNVSVQIFYPFLCGLIISCAILAPQDLTLQQRIMSMKKCIFVWLTFVWIGPASFCFAQSTPQQKIPLNKVETEILQLEDLRFNSMVKNDLEALTPMLSDELVYIHSNGTEDTKSLFLKSLSDKKLVYQSIRPEDRKVRIYGATGVVTGRVQMQANLNGQDMNIHLRYTEVYVKRKEQWQLVSWQSTRLPE